MNKGSGRIKGASFERLVAKLFTEACSCLGTTKKDCYRTPLSGGHPYADKGDLVISPLLLPYLPFSVECKHQKIWYPGAMLAPRKTEQGWLEQVKASSSKERLPLLIMSGNATGIFAAFQEDIFHYIFSPVTAADLSFIRFQHKKEMWIMTEVESFLFEIRRRAQKKKPFQFSKGRLIR